MIVGCGRIAGGYNRSADDAAVLTHALAYKRHPRFDLVAAVDGDAQARASFAAQWGAMATFASLDEALAAHANVDVVSVCVPTTDHVRILDRLVRSPVKAVFGEKPLGGDPIAAEGIVQRFAAEKKPLAVAYLRRWDPAMKALKEEITSDAWGDLRAGTVVYGRGVTNNGSHAIDLLHYFVGQPLRIDTVTGHRDDGVSGDPSVDAVLALPNGARIHLVAADGRDYSVFEVTLVFAKGLVSIEDGGMMVRRRRAEQGEFSGIRRPGDGTRERSGFGNAFLHALDDLVDAIETGSAPASNGETALPAIALAAELRQRAADGDGRHE